MILKTKEFKEIAALLLKASSADAADLEIATRGTDLRLSVTNREFYFAVMHQLEEAVEFKATVKAKAFLELVSKVTTDTFRLEIKNTNLLISAGGSKYKLPMIYENDKIMELPKISIHNRTVEMKISKDILTSILNVNKKEVSKADNAASLNELQKLYYIDENGCFTFTTGACLNEFKLEKPIKLLLNDRIVSLFGLFKEDVDFVLGQDPISDTATLTKISLVSGNIYLAAIVTNDDVLISKIQGPCTATKRFMAEHYDYSVVISANDMASAIDRIMSYSKNSGSGIDLKMFPANINISGTELTISDNLENSETITIENNYATSTPYELAVNLNDLKLVVDSCKADHVTFNCGNHRSIVITRGAISNLIPELRKA